MAKKTHSHNTGAIVIRGGEWTRPTSKPKAATRPLPAPGNR